MVVREVLMPRRWVFRWGLGLTVLSVILSHSALAQENGWLNAIPVTASGEEALSPAVIPLGDSTVCVLWSQFAGGKYRLFSRRWVDGSWEPEVFIENNEGDALYPVASLSSGILHVAWVESFGYRLGRVWVARSLDGGTSWGSPQFLSEGYSGSSRVTISASGSAVHLVWAEPQSVASSLVYSRSLDGGVSWSDPNSLASSSIECRDPWMCANGMNVSVIWEDWRNGGPEVYFRRSLDSGVTWTKEFSLSLVDKFASEGPRIAVTGAILQSVWSEDTSAGTAVIYARSTDNGSSWIRKWLTTPQDSSPVPSLAVSGKNTLVAYQKHEEGAGEILTIESYDTGVTWTAPVHATAVDGFRSMLPSLFLRTDFAFLGWMDLLPSGPGLWFARNPPMPGSSIPSWQDY